jgi:hypothetical protein
MRLNTHTRHFTRSLAAAVAVLALAAPTAPARPAEQYVDPPSSCEAQWSRQYDRQAHHQCEQQVLASRGTGAPAGTTEATTFPGLAAQARAATASLDTPRPAPVSVSERGFEWASAAIGAAVAAGLIALIALAAPAVRTRRRVRTAS